MNNGGKVSKHRRKPFAGRVPENVFDYIEEVADEAFLPGMEAPPDSAPIFADPVCRWFGWRAGSKAHVAAEMSPNVDKGMEDARFKASEKALLVPAADAYVASKGPCA
jgi:hypothetical protein